MDCFSIRPFFFGGIVHFCVMNALKTINIKGKLMQFDAPKVMGIINLTPDSFYEQSRKQGLDAVLDQAEKMLAAGAHFIDLGAVSTRPGSVEISADEEKKRLYPALESLVQHFPEACISVDTYRAALAEDAVALGAAMINDVSGGLMDGAMFETVAKLQIPYILMHMRGTPQTMTDLTRYERFPEDIILEMATQINHLRAAGMNDILVDPGFGFAKTTAQNFHLLRELGLFQTFQCPILVGISRKGMIHRTLGISPQEALNGTTALHMAALERGADILRVHDVKEALECVNLYSALQNEGN